MGVIRDLLLSARLLRSVWVLWRYIKTVQDPETRRVSFALRRPARAERFHAALANLGPSYVKLGQFLATRPDMIGVPLADALRGLQDRMPPFDGSLARRVIEAELGQSIDDLFATFENKPVAAGSIAQVHRGNVVDNEGVARAVAIKVRRPGVTGRFFFDLRLFAAAARMLERFSAEARRLRPVAAVEALHHSAEFELDFRLEAAAISESDENLKDLSSVRIPNIDWKRTSEQVLTIEWLDGTSLADAEALEEAGFDRSALANIVIQSFIYQALHTGFFHADMHQGNLLACRDRDGQAAIAMFDFGIMGRINPRERQYLAGILHGFLKRDYRRIAELHVQVGYVPPSCNVGEFSQALRAIGEPIHGLPACEISMGQLLGQLFDVTRLFGMVMQPQLLLLQKTMVVSEGVARTLDDQVNIWTASEEVVAQWVETMASPSTRVRELGDQVTSMLHVAQALAPLLQQLPARVSQGAGDSFINGATTDSAEGGRGGVSWTQVVVYAAAVSAAVTTLLMIGLKV